MTPAARDAYFAWQAEIGTEEVLLVTPPPRRTPAAPPVAAAANTAMAPSTPFAAPAAPVPARTAPPADFGRGGRAGGAPGANTGLGPGRPAAPTFVPSVPPSAGPEFFGAIADQLKQADRAASAGRRAAGPRPAETPTAAAQGPVTPPWLAPVLEAKDLDAYWRVLDAEVPRWFAGAAAPVARAAGHAAPRLAVVELSANVEGPFTGDEGALLDRMMTAIGLSRDQLYLTSLMKTPLTPGHRGWARKDTARMVPVLLHELKLAQCGLVLIMGETCAQALLKTGRAIPDLLRQPTETEGLSLSATWHPAEVRAADASATATNHTASPDGKAVRPRATQAWEHLQWLRGLLPTR